MNTPDTSTAVINEELASQTTTSETDENAEAEAPRSNAGFTKADFIKEVRKFGRDFGAGANSRPAMAMRAVEAAAKLTDISPEDDAKFLYTEFQQEAAKKRGIEYRAEASFAVQVSKLKQFLVLGALTDVDGVVVMEKTVDVIKELSTLEDSPLRGSAYDNMVNVARAQLKQPSAQLSEDDIRGILTPTEKEKTALDKLLAVYKSAYRLFEKEEVTTEGFVDALHSLQQSITEMGGEIPQPSEKQKAAQAIATQLKRSKAAKAEAARIATEAGIEVPAEAAA